MAVTICHALVAMSICLSPQLSTYINKLSNAEVSIAAVLYLLDVIYINDLATLTFHIPVSYTHLTLPTNREV